MLGRNILSRAILLRTLKNAANIRNQIRNDSHGVWSYRVPPPMPCKKTLFQAQILGGVCWWWILYHCATEPEHIFGEWTYVDPSTWTDAELGIPPDSAGPLKK